MFKNRFHRSVLAAAVLLMTAAATLPAQVLHTNNKWDQCAMVIDASLTQDAWHQFVGEAALVMYYRPLTSAKPLGRGNVEFALLQTATGIDDADAAWNDTFSHPDADHWLFEGSALKIPSLGARVGVTDRLDIGAYFTKSIGANYAFAGGQVQYNVLNDTTRKLAVAARATAVHLFGPEDLTETTFGADLLVSKDISFFTPYVGVTSYWSHGHERTTKVNLEDENIGSSEAMAGVTVNFSRLRLGAEYHTGKVAGYSIKVGVGI